MAAYYVPSGWTPHTTGSEAACVLKAAGRLGCGYHP